MTLAPPGRAPSTDQIKCADCPLNKNEMFRSFTPEELAFMQKFKTGEMLVEAGSSILLEGNNSAHLYTILSGWVFRYKLLEDGRRQILNFGLPGDFIGLQTSMFDELSHSVESLTEVVLCVFQRDKVWNLYKKHPALGFDMTWLAAREERFLDENLLNVGRRTALERVAYMLLHIYFRLKNLGMVKKKTADLPFTQQQLADSLGLSHVHTNKTVKKLTERGLIKWDAPRFEIRDLDAMIEISGFDFPEATLRPLI